MQTVTITKLALMKAIEHTVNYHSVDAKLSTADWELAERWLNEMWKHLLGETDVQIIERMTPEERAKI